MNLMVEVGQFFPICNSTSKFHCKVFEENRSCIKVVQRPKYTPQTKHIVIKYHNFRSYVADVTIDIQTIDTKEKLADIFTKPLDRVVFERLREPLMGW